MRYFLIFSLAILVVTVTNTAAAQTSQTKDPPQLVESRDLTTRVVELYSEHKYDEALPLAKRALALAEEAVGKTDARLIVPLLNLGQLYVVKLDQEKAKASFARALSVGEAAFGHEDIRLTRPLDELAYRFSRRQDYDKAAELFSRSLTIKRKFLAKGDIEIARAVYALADTYRLSREYEKSETLFREALQLYEESQPKKNAEIVELLKHYLMLLTAQNKKDEAALVRSKLADLSAETTGVVDGGLLNSLAVELGRPEYPAVARSAHASGQVAVQVLIDETGKVISATAMRGHPLLHKAAVAAAKRSKFSPTLRSGVPIKVRGTIIYNFVAF